MKRISAISINLGAPASRRHELCRELAGEISALPHGSWCRWMRKIESEPSVNPHGCGSQTRAPDRASVRRGGLGFSLPDAFILCFSWFLIQGVSAQEFSPRAPRLPRDEFRNGAQTLLAFEPISRAARDSVVKLDLDGNTVALAAVVDATGLAVTKASEIREGKLTAWLATGKEVEVRLIAKDEDTDLALVKVDADNLKPIQWATEETSVGQWVVTPGIAQTPQAVGIVSVPPRKIPPPRAFIGIVLDFRSPDAKIAQILEGLGAEAAGLKPGDVILKVNDAPVNEGQELVKTLRAFREGQSVTVRVQRGEEEFDAPIKMMVPKPEAGGRGFDRAARMNRMGSVPSQRAEGFELAIQHDTVLQNWQCGGPLMNLAGQAVGLNIARAGRVASYALPGSVVRSAIAHLQAQH